RQLQPAGTRDFFNLAAVHIRRELLDLARHYARRPPAGPEPAGAEPAAETDSAARLELWCRFHEAVAALPPEEREVLGLVFYHGYSQGQVSELLGMSLSTVRPALGERLRRAAGGPGRAVPPRGRLTLVGA